ncbi:MAG TPA: alpha-ketoacid dehydrogenase subunit beta [Actinopolymorphaceae bacterium]
MTQLTIIKALNAGLRRALENDPKVVIMGEDVGKLGGVFRVTDGLQKDFGEERIIDTPLGESGIVGTAVGLAMRGYRPVCEIQFDGFVAPAYDQIVSQVAKLHFRSQGKVRMPAVIRIPFAGGIGAVEHHSESPEAPFVHTAGLKVVACSNPLDAYWMIQQAIASDDPVVFLEPKRRYHEKAEVDTEAESAPLPLHASKVVRVGGERPTAVLLCYGPMVKTCLEAAEAATSDGLQLTVIDLRTLSPLDLDPVYTAVRSCGRVAVVHEAPVTGGLGAELAARITQECFYSLEAPVLRVGGFDTPYPPARIEEDYLPDLDRVLDGVDRLLAY